MSDYNYGGYEFGGNRSADAPAPQMAPDVEFDADGLPGMDLVRQATEDGIEMQRILETETSAILAHDWKSVLLLADGKRFYAARLESNLKAVRNRRDELRSLGHEALAPFTDLQQSLADASRRNIDAVARARDINQRIIDMIADVARQEGNPVAVYGRNARTPALGAGRAAPVTINGNF